MFDYAHQLLTLHLVGACVCVQILYTVLCFIYHIL